MEKKHKKGKGNQFTAPLFSRWRSSFSVCPPRCTHRHISPKFSSAAAGWAARTQHTPCKQLSLPALLLLWLAQHFHHYPMERDVPAELHAPSPAQ